MTEICIQSLQQIEQELYALGRELQIRSDELRRTGNAIGGSESQRLIGHCVTCQAQALAAQAQGLLDGGRLLERVVGHTLSTERRLVQTAEHAAVWAAPPPAALYELDLADIMQDVRIT